MAQNIKFAVAQTGESDILSDKLMNRDLYELGLEEDTEHLKITFDNEQTTKYAMLSGFFLSVFSMIFWPFYIIFFPCILFGTKAWSRSRIAAVTDKQLVLKQGNYSCCCMFWNQTTKSVPLDKITDLQIQQGCLQRYYNVEEIRVETASATKEMPELRLIGVQSAREVRSQILKLRDGKTLAESNTTNSNLQNYSSSSNPLLPSAPVQDSQQMQQLIASQHETMVEIKGVLQDMRTALVSMDNKMSQKANLEDTTEC